MLDLASINLNTIYNEPNILKMKAISYQIYKNVRPMIRNSYAVRNALNLETKVPGVYTIDLAFDTVEKMIQYCTFDAFTYKRCYIIAQHLNAVEIMLRDIMQFFSYFFRADFKQKPDIMVAAEKYKDMADKLTIEQLKEVIGKNNQIDFERLGIVENISDIENDSINSIEKDDEEYKDKYDTTHDI
jgi:hypothetical protein